MKIFQNKNTVLRSAIIAWIVFVFAQMTMAQQLKPTEILYSRLPADLTQPPVGANSPTIWAVGQDGSNDRQITTGMAPRISDDGRFLLFRRLTCTTPNFPYCYNPYASQPTARLFVRDLQSNTETMIFNYEGQSRRLIGYYFSPESNRGDFQIILDYGSVNYKMNIDGTNLTVLDPYFGTSVPREGDYFPVVRRGDSRIALRSLSGADPNNGLVTRTLGSELPVIVPNTHEGDDNPSWSNDNQYLGFTTATPNRGGGIENPWYPYSYKSLSKIKLDGSGKTLLLNTDAAYENGNGIAFGTIWTDDNSKIIIAARINGVAGLYAVKTDGSGYTRIPISAGTSPDWVGGIVQPREEQQVVSIAGGVTTGANYSLVTTIGETIAGQTSVGGSYTLESGFWAGLSASKKALFDFDGDGKADVSVFRPSNGAWYLQQSTNGFTGTIFGLSSDKIVPADYDGDGKTDVAVFRDGTWYLQRSSLGFTGVAFGAGTDKPQAADFDGDGKAELAVYRPSNGAWYIYNLTTNQFYGVNFGISEDVPAASDYDADGKADVAVFRPSSGTWYLQRSSQGFTGVQFGTSGDVPTAADYDGDGLTDVAVFRPSNGAWYLNRSQLGFTGVAFGAGSDVPVAADYDGDGRADVAVFRPSNGTWYLQQSAQGFTGIAFGANGDKPIPAAFAP